MIGGVARHRCGPTRTDLARAASAGLWCLIASLAGCGDREPGTLRVERVLGETGRQPGQFAYPRGIASFELDGRPTLAIVDKSARIQLIDAQSGEVRGLWRPPIWQLGMPTGLTVASHPTDPGRVALWVADTHEHRVLIYPLPFDTGGEPVEPPFQFGEYGYGDGQFVYTTDIAVLDGPDGLPARVFVGEYGGNDRVSEFRVRRETAGGADAPVSVRFEFVRQIGYSGVAMDAPEDDPAALSRPQSIEIRRRESSGGGAPMELVVADVGRHRVVRFDLESGAVVGWTDGTRGADGQAGPALRFPYGITLVGEDHALVAEFGESRLRVIELDSGGTVGLLGGPGRQVGQLATPWGSVVIGRELFILDSGNDRVQVVRWSGVAGVRGGTR